MSMERSFRPEEAHPVRHLFGIAGLIISSAVIVGVFAAVAFYASVFIQSGQMAAVVSSTLVALTNGDRDKRDLGELTVNPALVVAAQAKADDMAAKGYFSHTSPEGYDSWHWFELANYRFTYAGENLAVNFTDSENVERAWMDSPTHRANILNDKFTEIGIATAVGEYKGKKAVFVVQMFGTPQVAAVASQQVRTLTAPTTTPEETVVATTEAPEETAVLGTEAVAPTVDASPTVVDKALASPHTLLQMLYLVFALVVVVALGAIVGTEFKKHHIRHVAAAGFLLVLMGALLIVANYVIFVQPVVA